MNTCTFELFQSAGNPFMTPYNIECILSLFYIYLFYSIRSGPLLRKLNAITSVENKTENLHAVASSPTGSRET